ncbi:MAG: hypothetical protein AB1420_15230 [Bacillota bacterium]
MSAVVHITHGDISFLFTGDAEKEAERDLLESGYNLKATVFKVGHHGSFTSNSRDFISEVNPEYVVISAGKDNKYGHPHKEVLSLFEEFNLR